ncbi:heterokaryon incompatibility protein-domain-containing protein [Cenococcum geophilum]
MADSNFCDVCSGVDFERLVWPDKSGASEPLIFKLGNVKEIAQRSQLCALCLIITQAVKARGLEMNGQISILSSPFAVTLSHTPNPPHPELRVDHVVVQFTPSSFIGLHGPHLPSEDSAEGSTEPQVILTLQACSKPIPTAETACSESWKNLEWAKLRKFSGRLASPQFADIRLFRRWFNLCECLHGEECQQPLWLGSEYQAEALLMMDVEDSCIVKAPPQCRYIALSYVWGTANIITTTKVTINSFTQKGALQNLSLPATIRDSMALVKGIGERYLWVDALCVVQDDFAFQQSQISAIASIYSKALFTIVAAAGYDSNAGLPGVRTGTRSVIQQVVALENVTLIPVINVLGYGGIKDSKWKSRAWTLQEKLFSHRRLIFTTDQVYWQCRKAYWLEEMVLETVERPLFIGPYLSQHELEIEIPTSMASRSDYRQAYEALVSQYTSRQMTYASDMLNAFTGISSALAHLNDDIMLWGLPESQFSRLLTWGLDGHTRHGSTHRTLCQDGSEHNIPFPSWSWSAWNCFAHPPFRVFINRGPSETEPLIIFYRSSIEGKIVKINEFWNKSYGTGPPDAEALDSHDNNGLISQWIGKPRYDERAVRLAPGIEFIDSGLLHFWTSTATVYVLRRKAIQWSFILDPFRYEVLDTNGEVLTNLVHMGSTSDWPRHSPALCGGRPGKIEALISEEADVLAFDLAIVNRSASPPFLQALIIYWNRNIASRIGHATVSEAKWVKLENRVWQTVTLG